MSKGWKVAASSLLIVAVVLGTAGAAVAAELIKINVPAPVSQAEGIGLNVGDLLAVGHSDTSAGANTGDAVANAVEIGGKPIIGGSQSGPGENSGALLDTKQTPLGRLEVAPWQAKVTETADTRTAEAAAAAARANLIDPDVASVDVLQSDATSTHTDLLSQALATSDALVLNFGGPTGFTVKLLHSESSSSAKGLTYIIAINDTPLISVDELGGKVCSLNLPEVLQITCLTVTGGVGSVSSQVLGLAVGGVNGLTAQAIGSAGSGGAAQTTPAAVPTVVEGTNVTRSAPPATGGLARTGSEILFTASFAVALMALGTVLIGIRKVAIPAVVTVR
jgi:hypothetical protein